MGKLLLGLLVLFCLGLSAAGGASFFAKKVYMQGCKDEALEIVDIIAKVSGSQEAADQLKQILFNECEEKAKNFSLKELYVRRDK